MSSNIPADENPNPFEVVAVDAISAEGSADMLELDSSSALITLDQKIQAVQRGKLSRMESAMQNLELRDTEEQVWVRRVHATVSKLHLFDPARKTLKTRLTKCFYRWSMCLPLEQKCVELARQLQERNHILDSVRESYVRDVIK
jgi:hypothetical protein